jgi:hypothetical protein
MNSSLKLLWMVILCAAAGCSQKQLAEVAAGQGATGTWNVKTDAPWGPGTPTFALTQNGEQLTGTYQGAMGQIPVTGTVKGKELTVNFTVSGKNGDMKVTYAGLVEGDSISGKLTADPLGEGTFTGTRKR